MSGAEPSAESGSPPGSVPGSVRGSVPGSPVLSVMASVRISAITTMPAVSAPDRIRVPRIWMTAPDRSVIVSLTRSRRAIRKVACCRTANCSAGSNRAWAVALAMNTESAKANTACLVDRASARR